MLPSSSPAKHDSGHLQVYPDHDVFPLPPVWNGTTRFRGSAILHPCVCVCLVQMRKENPRPPRGTGLGFPFFCLWNRVCCPVKELV